MKLILLIIAPLLFVSFNLFARAGGVDGGGGNGVVCYKEGTSEITSVELLDLYEARILYQLTPKNYPEDLNKILNDQAKKLSASTDIDEDSFRENFQKTSQIVRLLPEGVRLKPINDSFEVYIPRDCKIEQLANYKEANLILVVSDFWQKMNTLNKAALIVHENLNNKLREFGVKNSTYARKTLGFSFSTTNFEYIYKNLQKTNEFLWCRMNDTNQTLGGNFEFFMFPSICDDNTGDCGTIIEFDFFNSQPIYSNLLFKLDSPFDNIKKLQSMRESGPVESLIFGGQEVVFEIKDSKYLISVVSTEDPWGDKKTEMICE